MPLPADQPRGHTGYLPKVLLCAAALAVSLLIGCGQANHPDPHTLVFLIDSSPSNLDPRYATDSQSQRIDGLIFSSLLQRDDQMNLHGDLAESWNTPDPLTYVFHLRSGVRFQDGRPLTAADVKATFDFIRDPANRSPKRGAFQKVASIEAPNPSTVIFHLSEPYASFTTNLVRPVVGIVPVGAGREFSRRPIGSGPFRFVSLAQDNEVVLARNPDSFAGAPPLARVRFRIVPDAIVRALELRKGSADLELGSLTPDMIPVLEKQPGLAISQRPGVNLTYLGFNLEDPILGSRDVRQALAYATDRETLIRYLQRGEARVADSVLPPGNWAYEPNVTRYALDAARAEKLLDAAGYPRGPGGIRLHIILKTSTDEQYRLIGAALQEQWRRVGIDLQLRPLELATLLSDSVKGNFQVVILRWVGATSDPDFFEFAFSSRRFPPDGANRGHYRNPRVDALTDQIRVEMDREKRKEECSEVQKILANDLPYLPLWFSDVISVHRRSLGDLRLSPVADYDFVTRINPAASP